MGLLDSALGAVLGGLVQRSPVAQAEPSSQMPFKSHLLVSDGDSAYDAEAEVVALIGGTGVWKKIWEMTVPAQQKIRFGHGSPAYPRNQGYMFFVIVDEGADFSIGVVRLVQANARETRVYTVFEAPDSNRMHGTDKTTTESATPDGIDGMTALPEKVEFPKVAEDSRMQLWYKLVTAATTADAVAWSIPVTVYQ